jgi:hypothetical protein
VGFTERVNLYITVFNQVFGNYSKPSARGVADQEAFVPDEDVGDW